MLQVSTGGATKTRIMYMSYLSYAQLKEYLSVLVENGLMEYVPGERKYRTTEKGTRFLEASNSMSEMVGPMISGGA